MHFFLFRGDIVAAGPAGLTFFAYGQITRHTSRGEHDGTFPIKFKTGPE